MEPLTVFLIIVAACLVVAPFIAITAIEIRELRRGNDGPEVAWRWRALGAVVVFSGLVAFRVASSGAHDDYLTGWAFLIFYSLVGATMADRIAWFTAYRGQRSS